MKKIIQAITALFVLLVPISTALAQATCTVNGEEVPCEELGDAIGSMGAILFVFPLIMLVLFIFWLVMLIHAIRHEIDNKVLWILILLLVGPLGALIYYFVVKRPYTKMLKSGTPPQGGHPGMPQGGGAMPEQGGLPQGGTMPGQSSMPQGGSMPGQSEMSDQGGTPGQSGTPQ